MSPVAQVAVAPNMDHLTVQAVAKCDAVVLEPAAIVVPHLNVQMAAIPAITVGVVPAQCRIVKNPTFPFPTNLWCSF